MRIALMLGLALSVLFALGTDHAYGQQEHRSFTPLQWRLLSGAASHALELQEKTNVPVPAASGSVVPAAQPAPCAGNFGSNVRVNRNCQNLSDTDLAGRAQANNSPAIAQDPNNLGHLVAADNDFRLGDQTCMVAFSTNAGGAWQDSPIPLGFTRGNVFGAAREYWGASGEASVAWDTKGNSYIACQVFNRGMPVTANPDQSSAVYVFRSTGSHGSSWNFPGRPVVEAAVFNNGVPFEDKPYMTVDHHAGSPFQDRVYVTWTEFAPDGTAYIWQSFSNDYGQTFSGRVLVSGNTPLCANTFGIPTPRGNCNVNQFSQPFTGPDGSLYVVFQNFNNAVAAPDNRNQILLAKSTDGGNTFTTPVKVADFYDLPDCLTYQGQDAGRSCVPEKGSTTQSFFRAENYPVGAVNPSNATQVVVTFGSYINVDSRAANGCAPMGLSSATGLPLYTGVKTAGACNNKILLSVSNNGGHSFSGATADPRSLHTINQAAGHARTDQWWQWAAFTSAGKLAVSYYDRRYGSDETTGLMDVSLSSTSDFIASSTARVTTSSMPPPTQFSGLFMGDYSGLSAVDANAHPVWVDTRNRQLFLCPGTGIPDVPPAVCASASATAGNDQEIYTETLPVP